MEFNSIPFNFFINSIHFLHDFFAKLSSLCSHPLFTTIVTLYTLILLYAPSFFLKIAFSPVFNFTGIILLSLLRLGANERSEKELGYQESRIIDHGANEWLEKESRILDCDDNDSKRLPIEGGNLNLFSDLVLESNFVESKFHDQCQTHEEFLPKTGLGSKSNQTHVGIGPKTSLGLESNQTHVESDPKTGLVLKSNQIHVQPQLKSMESNQTHVDSEPKLDSESNSHDDYHKWELLETISMESPQVVEEKDPRMQMDLKQVDTKMVFPEWNIRAPLEIIYEAYEGEEEEEDEEISINENASSEKHVVSCERYPSLSMYYPETDTDSSSNDEFPMNENWEAHETLFFTWQEEEQEELIEISLDRYGKRSTEFCHVEDDNLIEIDIFPTRN